MSREIKESTITTSESFNREHTIEFNEITHRYKLDGKQAVGPSTFCKAGYPTSMRLISWMKGQTAEALWNSLMKPSEDHLAYIPSVGLITYEEKRELVKKAKGADKTIAQEAADIGTICHSFAELHSLGEKLEATALLDKVKGAPVYPLIETCTSKYLDWDAKNKGELLKAEALLGSPKYWFCGKIDRLDKINGRIRLRDYKTSSNIYVDQFIQQGAYAIGIEEWYGIAVDELEIVRFGKEDGEFETLLIDDPKEVAAFKDQAIRCRYTYEFKKLENDARFKGE